MQAHLKPAKQLKITLVRSRHGRSPKQRECIKALGLSKIRQTVIRENRSEIQGLLKVVGFLMKVEEVGYET